MADKTYCLKCGCVAIRLERLIDDFPTIEVYCNPGKIMKGCGFSYWIDDDAELNYSAPMEWIAVPKGCLFVAAWEEI